MHARANPTLEGRLSPSKEGVWQETCGLHVRAELKLCIRLTETVTQFIRTHLPLACVVAEMLWCCSSPSAVFAQPTNPVLTTAAEVLALPAERAQQGVPVLVKGVVTAAERYWNGKLFVQDASGGVFVDHTGGPQPVPGVLVAVSGISHAGGIAQWIGQ